MMRSIALVGVLAATLVVAQRAEAASPNYILVSGPGLARPVLLANWRENHELLLPLIGAPRANGSVVRGLAARPRFDLALFWGWGGRPRPTRPSQANQHGWFYPARGAAPAVFDLMINGLRTLRLGPVRTLRILARHGVPTRIQPRRRARRVA